MAQPILDQLRSVAHDAGAATGAAVTGLSEGAIDAMHSFDPDRVAEITAPYVEGAAGAATALGRRLTTKRVLIALGVLTAVGVTAAAIMRFRSRGDRKNAETASKNGVAESRDGNGARSEFASNAPQQPEAVAARG